MAAYTTPAEIAAYLGVTLTAEQQAQAQVTADAITAWIDHRTGRTWQVASDIADELQRVQGTTAYLDHPPVTTLGAIEQELVVPAKEWLVVPETDYELTDPQNAVITFVPGYNQILLRIDYATSATSPPADLAFAATVLAADLLGTTLHPESHGVESLALGQGDISVRYATGGAGAASPSSAHAVRVVDSYRVVVVA